jgi:hypothetical protein
MCSLSLKNSERMKIISIFILISVSYLAFSQDINKQKLEDLQKTAVLLEEEIKVKTASLNLIQEEIKHLQNLEYLSKFKIKFDELTMLTTLSTDGKLRKSSHPLSDVITHLKKNDTVKLTDYQEGYWVVNKDQYFGYLSEAYINDTEEIKIFREEIIRKNEEYRIKKENEAAEKKRMQNEKLVSMQKQKRNEYRQKILQEYGSVTGQKLLDGYYWLGMTNEMARISLGNPRNINRSVGSWGIHEQWVYGGGKYLYFENGILTSFQN